MTALAPLRKRGRVSAASLIDVPNENIDIRLGRPPAPGRLSELERQLWHKLTSSRRPGWFSGAEEVLESYVTTALQVQRMEAELRQASPTDEDYWTLLRLHRQTAALALSLAVRLRLTPSTKLDRRTPAGWRPTSRLTRKAPRPPRRGEALMLMYVICFCVGFALGVLATVWYIYFSLRQI